MKNSDKLEQLYEKARQANVTTGFVYRIYGALEVHADLLPDKIMEAIERQLKAEKDLIKTANLR